MNKRLLLVFTLISVAGCDANTERTVTKTEVCGVEMERNQALSDLDKIALTEGWCRAEAILVHGTRIRKVTSDENKPLPDGLEAQEAACKRMKVNVEEILKAQHSVSSVESGMCPKELKMRIEMYR